MLDDCRTGLGYMKPWILSIAPYKYQRGKATGSDVQDYLPLHIKLSRTKQTRTNKKMWLKDLFLLLTSVLPETTALSTFTNNGSSIWHNPSDHSTHR